MRFGSAVSQTCASRPSARTEKAVERRARTRKLRFMASAAESNAGPRFADVAGSEISNHAPERREREWSPLRTLGRLLLERADHRVRIRLECDGAGDRPLIALTALTMTVQRVIRVLEHMAGQDQHDRFGALHEAGRHQLL